MHLNCSFSHTISHCMQLLKSAIHSGERESVHPKRSLLSYIAFESSLYSSESVHKRSSGRV